MLGCDIPFLTDDSTNMIYGDLVKSFATTLVITVLLHGLKMLFVEIEGSVPFPKCSNPILTPSTLVTC
jgi:hypothetical protein